jgi:hypothetical protein
VKPDPVIGQNLDRAPAPLAEGLVPFWIGPQPDATDGYLLGGNHGASGCCHDPSCQPSDAR